MIRGLLYLTATRLDIMHAVCLVARFQAGPRESHVMAVKRIFRYLKSTPDHGLWYLENNDFTLSAYIDADWARCADDRRSTSGGVFFLGDRAMSWKSKKQDSMSLSTVEVEYVAVAPCCTQVLQMRQTLKAIKVEYDDPIIIFYDNTNAINILKNLVMHSRTEHISIRYHILREKVVEKEVKRECVSTKD